MIGAFPIHRYNETKFKKYEDDDKDPLSECLDYISKLESRIKELEAQLEALSPGILRG